MATASDGRVQRGARNRARIVEALRELIREGFVQPTAEQVAKRAGVGTRTVFRHFADMEGLYAELSALVEQEVAPLLPGRPQSGPPEARLLELLRQRVLVFERIAPFKRAGESVAWHSEFVRGQQAQIARSQREQLLRALPELEEARPELLEALDAFTAFESWSRLRATQRLGRERALRVLEAGALALLTTALG